MDINDFQLPPPTEWGKFEDLCLTVFREEWGDPNAQKNGRRGQAQYGVDISGYPRASPGEVHGVQCKGKDTLLSAVVTKSELEEEVRKALTFKPALTSWILVTTAPKDAVIEAEARSITARHLALGLFRVTILGWEDLKERITDSDVVMTKHYPDLAPRQKMILAEMRAMRMEGQGQTATIQMMHSEAREFQAVATAQMAFIASVLNGVPQSNTITDANEALIQALIDDAKSRITEGEPASALRQLERLIATRWSDASSYARFRLLANKAAALFNLERNDEAVQASLDAYQYAPNDPRAVVFAAQAYLIKGEGERARTMLDQLLSTDSSNADAQALRIAASIDEDAVTDPFWVVPDLESAAWNVLLSAARWFRGRKRHKESLDAFEKALRHDPDRSEVAADAASCMLEDLSRDRAAVFAHRLDPEQRGNLLHAVDQLRRVWGKVKNTEMGGAYIWAFSNLVTALRYLDELQETSTLSSEAVVLYPNRQELVHARILVAAARGEHGEVLSLLERLNSNDAEARLIRSDALDALKRPSEALDALEDFPETALPRLQATVAASRVKLLHEVGRGNEALSVAQDIVAVFPYDAFAQIVLSDAYRRLGDTDQALHYAHIAATVADRSPQGDGLEVMIVAETLAHLGDWDGTASLLSNAGDPKRDSEAPRHRVSALLNAGRRQELRALLIAMPEEIARKPPYARAAGWLYRLSGDYAAARGHLETYLEQVTDDLGMRTIWLDIVERQNDSQAIAAFLSSNIEPLYKGGRTRDLMALAQFMARHMQPQKGLELAYRTLRDRWSHPAAHRGYIALMVITEDVRVAIPSPTSIGPGVAFTVENEVGQRRTYIVESALDLKAEFNEISPGSRLAMAAAGLTVGELLRVNDNDLMPQQRIVDLVHKSVSLLHRTFREFNGLFPDDNSLMSLNIDSDHPERFIDNMRPGLAAMAATGREMLRQYETQPLPIAFAARAIGIDPIDGWHAIRHGKVAVDACLGVELERDEALRLLNERPQLVVEPMTFWIAGVLGILDALTATFGPLGLAATSVELLEERERSARDNLVRGRGTMAERDGEVIIVGTSEEERRGPAELASRLLGWANTNAVIIPAIPREDIDPDFRRLGEMAHPSLMDTIVAASGSGRVLLCEDRRLRDLASGIGVNKSSWLQPAMLIAKARQSLSTERYSDNLLDLSLWGHRLTSLDSPALLRATVRWGVDSLHMFGMIAEALSTPTLDPHTLHVVLLSFMKELWSQPRARATKEKFTAITLQACRKSNPGYPLRLADQLHALSKRQRSMAGKAQARQAAQASQYVREWDMATRKRA